MMIPVFSPTATERILPRLALDFTIGVLDPRVTVTRALDTATRINSSGFVATINANLPRFDYDPVTLAPKGLLIEEQRTNLFVRSATFDDASWAKGDTTVTADSAVAPDGASTADKIVATATSAFHNVYQSVTETTAAQTFSVYAKASEYSKLQFADAGAGAWSATFDLASGSTISTGGAAVLSSSIQDAGNGWFRCAITYTGSGAFTAHSIIGYPNAGATLNNFGASYTGDGTSGIFVWGAQLEAGAFATSYIPTTTTSLTRNADVVSMTGTNFSSWYNASAGTFVATATPYAIGSYCIFAATNGGFNNRMQAPAADSVQWLVGDGGAIQAFLDAGNFIAGAQAKVAASYKSNLFAVSLNGGAPASIASGTVPAVDRLDIGNLAGFAEVFNGWIPSIRYFPQSLTSAELQAFSK